MSGQTGSVSEELEQSILFRRFLDKPEAESGMLDCAVASTAAHVRMLESRGIVSAAHAKVIFDSLVRLHKESAAGTRLLSAEDIDIYSALERHLTPDCGELVQLVRTAKSTNDQLTTDLRLWLRGKSCAIGKLLLDLRLALLELAVRDMEVVMPGYTHMQPAEAILLSHWWLAVEARFCRDYSRLQDFYRRLNQLPLGACVLSGTREPIDRNMVADLLGFDDVIENSVDAISDRDYIIEFGAFATIVGLHLSQLGSELLLWATQEFAFIWLPRHMTVHSQTLPLKRNPELLEVLRARPSLIYGRLMEFISHLKGITSGFAQDLQECLPGLADVADTLKVLLELSAGLLPGIELDSRRMREVACADLVNVGAALEYLITRGVERNIATRVVEQLGTYCRTRNKYLSDLGLNEWQQFSPVFENDIYEHVSMEESVGAFCSFGGSSKDQVEQALERARKVLTDDRNRAEAVSERCRLSKLWGDG